MLFKDSILCDDGIVYQRAVQVQDSNVVTREEHFRSLGTTEEKVQVYSVA